MTTEHQQYVLLEQVRSRLSQVLAKDIGARDVEEDEDRDLTFRFQGGFYCIRFYPDDPQFVSIAFPAFFEPGSRIGKGVVTTACLEITRSIKLVKMFPVSRPDGSEHICAAVELMVPDASQLGEGLVFRCLDAIQVAVREFFEALALRNTPESVIAVDDAPVRGARHH